MTTFKTRATRDYWRENSTLDYGGRVATGRLIQTLGDNIATACARVKQSDSAETVLRELLGLAPVPRETEKSK